MPLVSAKCTDCGANLKVDNTKDAAICEFCGSAFIVEKAINNYNITNNNNINANVVNIYGGNSADFQIRAGVLEKYTGASTVVVIPNSVTIIADEAFAGCRGLKNVTIPNSVTEIGHRAFKGCSSLTSITIPNSVTEIGGCAFEGCSSLTSIAIPNGVTEISMSAFYGCSSLTSITIPNSVTEIGHRAFEGCSSLTSITIPNSVTEISKCAFQGCSNLTSITIPNSVTEIGGSAFKDCEKLYDVKMLGKPEMLFISSYYYPFKNTAYEWKEKGLCQHCGGTFKGVFNKVCSKCGKPKDY